MGITIEPTRCADLSSLSRRTFLSVGDRTSTLNNGNANSDSDLFIFYNQIKSVPGFVIEPYTLLDCIIGSLAFTVTPYPQPQRDATEIYVIQATSVHDYRKSEY